MVFRRMAAAAAAVLVLVHLTAYSASGWIARALLARRTLDGERQTPEQWTALLHDIVLRSGVVLGLVLAAVLALVANGRTRGALAALYRAEDSPRRLGVFRAIFFFYILFAFDPEQTLLFARLPPALIRGLSDPLPLWRLIVPAPALSAVLVKVFLASTFFAAIGLFTRVSALGVAGLGFYLLGLPQIFGKVNHSHHLLWFALILGLAPSGDGFGVDAWVRARLRAPAPPARARAYALPLRVIWILIGVIYFWPGFWKLVQHGPSWVLPENFRGHLYLRWFEDEGFSPLFRIDRYPLLCTLGSCFTIFFEMSWIFLIPFRRTRWLAIAMGLAFHNMTAAILNISFTSLQTCYAVFVDWDAVLGWLERRAGPRSSGALRRAARALDARAGALVRSVAAAPWAAAAARAAWRSRPSGAASLRAVQLAGALLFVGNMAYGAMHQTDAWPFTCYPTFSTNIKHEHRTLYARIRSPVRGDRAVASARAMRALRSERYAALLYGVVREREPGRRQERLEALSTVLYEIDDSIRPGETIDIHEAVFSTDPDDARRPRGDALVYSAQIGRGAR